MDIGVRFGKRLKALRSEAKLSQEDLANAARLSRVYVGAIERGAQVPSLDTVEKLARALGVTLSVLVQLEDERRRGPSLAEKLGRRVALAAREASARDIARFERLTGAFFKE